MFTQTTVRQTHRRDGICLGALASRETVPVSGAMLAPDSEVKAR